MNVTINDSEITKAIIQYVATQGIDVENKQIDVELTMGRKGNGATASIAINSITTDISEDISTEEIVKESEEVVPTAEEVIEEVIAATASLFEE